MSRYTFYSAYREGRPVRLCEATRRFAYESLHFKYGRQTRELESLPMDDIPDFDQLTPFEQYDLSIARIAERCPLRLCEDERVSGASTVGLAIGHYVPVRYHGNPVVPGISHLTLDFGQVLTEGIDALRRRVEAAIPTYTGDRQRAFGKSAIVCLDAMKVWHGRYLDALRDRPEYRENYENLLVVPFSPATTFHQAVQSLWFTFDFCRLCGNWPGIGRIDRMLGPYLKKDLAEGRLTLDEAREILAHFFIKGCEWICGGESYVTGDAQHYQNLVLAGVDEDGNDAANEVTYLVLDIIEELGISDFPTSVRLSRSSDPRLVRRVSEVIRHGGGTVAVYNEDVVLKGLTEFGYPLREARNFANDGCWEIQIPGATRFYYWEFDALTRLQYATLRKYDGSVHFDTFEDLLAAYENDLDVLAEDYYHACNPKDQSMDDYEWPENVVCTLISLFEHDCIERGRLYYEGGPRYSVTSFHVGGLADAVNSLYAIKKLVFDEKKISFDDFMTVLRQNWEGEEPLRRFAMNHYRYYGNDNEEVDAIAARILDDFSDMCARRNGRCPVLINSGVSTFGRQIDWAPDRLASAHGRLAGEVLAGNCSPTPGTDREGATAVIRSYCRADMSKQVNGAALDLELLPSHMEGEGGLCALEGLLNGFIELGGSFMQIDVTDPATLRDAQAHPENYPTLSVRVSGWNARFVTLCREWQDMVIARAEKGVQS